MTIAHPSIAWTDEIGSARLYCLAYALQNWTPDLWDVGDSKVGVGSGRTYYFGYRTDHVASFEFPNIANTELVLALRLKSWLVRGGAATIYTEDALAHVYLVVLAPPASGGQATLPALTFTDTTELEYTLALVVKNVDTPTPRPMPYLPVAHARPASISLSPSPVTMSFPGSTHTIVATVRDASGNPIAGETLAGISGNPASFTVSPASGVSDGSGQVSFVLTPAAGGTNNFSVSDGGVSASDVITVSTDDITGLTTALGGRTTRVDVRGVNAFWTTRRGIRLPYSATDKPIAWDDADVDFTARPTGRYYSPQYDYRDALSLGAFNAADASQHVTIGVWGQVASLGGNAPYMGTVLSQWSSSGWIFEMNSGYDVVLYIGGGGSDKAYFAGTGLIVPGQPFKLFWVYDGTGAGNADRVKCYLSTWDDVLDAWSARAAVTLSFGGTIPSTWPSASTRNLRVGYRDDGGGDVMWGIVDDVRLWSGTSLSTSQIDAEKVRSENGGANANAVTADVWLTFEEAVGASTIVNHGSSGSANNVTRDAGSHGCLLSDHIEGGHTPLLFVYAHAPAWDGTAKTLTWSGGNEWAQSHYQRRFTWQTGSGPGPSSTNHPLSIVAVGSVPDNNGLICSVRGSSRIGIAEVSGQGMKAYPGDAYASAAAGVSPSSTRYALILAYDGAATANPDNTKQQVYAHAIVKTANNPSESAPLAYFILNTYYNGGHDGGNYGNDGVFTAYAVVRGQVTDGEMAAIGAWAVANEGATAAS